VRNGLSMSVYCFSRDGLTCDKGKYRSVLSSSISPISMVSATVRNLLKNSFRTFPYESSSHLVR
jgi:hypothetical protein